MTERYSGEQDEGRQHPAEYRADLNPDALNLERIAGSAADFKSIIRELNDVPESVLSRVPIVDAGSRLKQGATYFDMAAPQLGEFVATGDMEAGQGSRIVPKAQTDREAWDFLLERFGLSRQ